MADEKTTSLTAIAAAAIAADDVLPIADVSVPQTKKVACSDLSTALRLMTPGVYYAEAYGAVDATLAVDSAPAIQAAIDAAYVYEASQGGVVEMPRGVNTYRVDSPINVRPGVRLKLNGAGLRPTFGSGFVVNLRGIHAAITTGTSLATGTGLAMRVSRDNPFLNLWTEPNLSVSALTAFSVRLFVKRVSESQGAYVYSGCNIVLASTSGFAVWEYTNSAIRVVWNSVDHITANNVLSAVGTVDHIALVFDGVNVKLWVNGTQVLSFSAGGGTVPQLPTGTEMVTIGREVVSPSNASASGDYADCWIDSVEFLDSAVYTSSFTPPTAKHSASSHTLLLMNFDDLRGQHVVGQVRVGGTRGAWFLPGAAPEVQTAGCYLEGGIIGGDAGASGVNVHDGQKSEMIGVTTDVACWVGVAWTGVTFKSKAQDCNFNGAAWPYVHVNQSEEFLADNLGIAGGGVMVYFEGPVGGAWVNLSTQPLDKTWAHMIVNANDVNIYYMQYDQEGAVATLHHNFVCIGRLKLFGGLLSGFGSDFPVFNCLQGGSVHVDATSFAFFSVGEVIRHTVEPAVKSWWNPGVMYQDTPTVSLTPQYVMMPHAPLPSVASATDATSVIARLNDLLAALKSTGQMLS